jgi:hypothetical protein
LDNESRTDFGKPYTAARAHPKGIVQRIVIFLPSTHWILTKLMPIANPARHWLVLIYIFTRWQKPVLPQFMNVDFCRGE